MTAHADTIYITALCQSDRLKTLEIYKNCFPAVERWIKQNNGSLQDAKDVFQQAIIDLYTRACVRKSFTLTTKICSFLGYASRMKWLKELSRKKPVDTLRNQVETEYRDVTASIETQIIESEQQQAQQQKLQQSFDQLSERCRTLLDLDAKGHSTEEIIELMNFSNRNVLDASKSRCYRKWRELYQAMDV